MSEGHTGWPTNRNYSCILLYASYSEYIGSYIDALSMQWLHDISVC